MPRDVMHSPFEEAEFADLTKMTVSTDLCSFVCVHSAVFTE